MVILFVEGGRYRSRFCIAAWFKASGLATFPGWFHFYELFINPLRHPYAPARNISMNDWVIRRRMKHGYQLQEDLDCDFDIYERLRRLIEASPWAWQSIGAMSGLVGGVLTPVIGTLLIAVTWFFHSEGIVSSLNGLSIAAFVLTIPLLTFGAHCLDLLERKTARLSVPAEQPSEELASASPDLRDARQGERRRLKLTGASAAVALLFVLPTSVHAQQTIFKVPGTDVLDKGKVYRELDVTFKPPNGNHFVNTALGINFN
jgi:hypothetical protein